MNIKQTCRTFLKDKGIISESYKPETILKKFSQDMISGLEKKNRALAMLPSRISPPDIIKTNEKILLIDAGGTNIRVSVIYFNDKYEIMTEYFQHYQMPGISEEISADDFFNQLAIWMIPPLKITDKVAFCFSYPSEITEDKDAILIHWAKEIKIPEVVGKRIGSNLKNAVKKKGAEIRKLTILNDTTATLLAGLTIQRTSKAAYLGLIVGTGTNLAYVERTENIKKIHPEGEPEYQIINMESGNFCSVDQSEIDKKYDETTAKPGSHIFEKMISGAYLGPLLLYLLKEASKTNIFTPQTVLQLSEIKNLESYHFDKILAQGGFSDSTFSFMNPDEKEAVRIFAKTLQKRAANLIAGKTAAATLKTGEKKLIVSIDGTTILKMPDYLNLVKKALYEILNKRGISFEFVTVSRAPTAGAAIAGLAE